MSETIDQVKKALAEATNGPWKVYEKIYEEDKPYLAERLIGTAYDHPQLKGPDSIVSNSWCIYEPHNRVVIDKENAHLIANAPEWLFSLITTIESQNEEIEQLKSILRKSTGIIGKPGVHGAFKTESIQEGEK